MQLFTIIIIMHTSNPEEVISKLLTTNQGISIWYEFIIKCYVSNFSSCSIYYTKGEYSEVTLQSQSQDKVIIVRRFMLISCSVRVVTIGILTAAIAN